MTQRPLGRQQRRVGVVLGAGGVLGGAWMAGALAALQDRLDRPLPELDLVVGTSAGSVLASALRCGVDAQAIVAHQRGAMHAALPRIGELDRDSPLPPLPRLRLGSPQLLANLARAPHRVHPWVAASALVPHGRGQHRYVSKLVHSLLAHAGQAEPDAAGWAWPRADTWIIAVDYDSGRRVAFGRTGSPEVSLADAVVASCSIPGWYEPKQIGERRYIDGGVRSTTSLALLARMDLDEVYVLAPMASHETDNPRHPAWRAERRFRRWVADRLAEEARTVAATGARVIVLTPGPADLAAMGINLMDASRRLHVLETALETSPGRWAAAA